jgi:hypothetical protein
MLKRRYSVLPVDFGLPVQRNKVIEDSKAQRRSEVFRGHGRKVNTGGGQASGTVIG